MYTFEYNDKRFNDIEELVCYVNDDIPEESYRINKNYIEKCVDTNRKICPYRFVGDVKIIHNESGDTINLRRLKIKQVEKIVKNNSVEYKRVKDFLEDNKNLHACFNSDEASFQAKFSKFNHMLHSEKNDFKGNDDVDIEVNFTDNTCVKISFRKGYNTYIPGGNDGYTREGSENKNLDGFKLNVPIAQKIQFGKYKDCEISQVNDINYLTWFYELDVCSDELRSDIKSKLNECKMEFGQYKGRLINDVMLNDMNYVKWLVCNVKNRFEVKIIMLKLKYGF